jgi:hypothetical protein
MPRLDLRMTRVPLRTVMTFSERARALDEPSAAALDTLARAIAAHPGLLVLLEVAAGEGDPAARAAAVREALVARGVTDTAIRIASAEGVPPQDVIATIERPAAQ